ncbi:MAG: hypothetical protein HRU20_29510 [Pseudomonadales bacterium]|nr:hypothetical protein [Pseudomonadales bacterium]
MSYIPQAIMKENSIEEVQEPEKKSLILSDVKLFSSIPESQEVAIIDFLERRYNFILHALNRPFLDLAEQLTPTQFFSLIRGEKSGCAIAIPLPQKTGPLEEHRIRIRDTITKLNIPGLLKLSDTVIDTISDYSEISIPSRVGLQSKLLRISSIISLYKGHDLNDIRKDSGLTTRTLKDYKLSFVNPSLSELLKTLDND